VFSDSEARLWLEQLTHPLIGEEIQRQLGASSSPYTVLSSPLLLETQQKQLVDFIVVVDVPRKTQIARTVKRDNNDEAQVKRIISAQIDRADRVAQADYVLDNSRTLAELREASSQLHENLLTRSAKHSKES